MSETSQYSNEPCRHDPTDDLYLLRQVDHFVATQLQHDGDKRNGLGDNAI